MLKKYNENHDKLQEILTRSDYDRLKITEVKESVYSADEKSEKKITSLIAAARFASLAPIIGAGYLTQNTTWKIILTTLTCMGVYLGIHDFITKLRGQKEDEKKASELIDDILNKEETRSL